MTGVTTSVAPIRNGCVSFVAMYAAANVPNCPPRSTAASRIEWRAKAAEHGEKDDEVHDDGDGAVFGKEGLNSLLHGRRGYGRRKILSAQGVRFRFPLPYSAVIAI
jgi:hypothetical protein